MQNTLKKTGRFGVILAVTGFIAAPALLTGCDNTETSKRTSKSTVETPTQKTTVEHTDKVKTTDKTDNNDNTNNTNNTNNPGGPH
jgi:hypothetical protein